MTDFWLIVLKVALAVGIVTTGVAALYFTRLGIKMLRGDLDYIRENDEWHKRIP